MSADPNEALLASLRELRDRVCACTAPACAGAADEDRRRWEEENISQLVSTTPTPEQDAAANKLFDELEACRTRAHGVPTDLGELVRWARDKVCACTDYDCTMEARRELMTWGLHHTEEIERLDGFADLLGEMDACAERVRPKKP